MSISHRPPLSNDIRSFSPGSLAISQIEYLEAHGVLTISAPNARNITSFSKLILAGRVIIHAYPLRAHAIASPIPDISVSPMEKAIRTCVAAYLSAAVLHFNSLVGSITILFPGINVPSFSASSTILFYVSHYTVIGI
jgi:hypothetical protein